MKATKTNETVKQANQVLVNLQVVYQNFRTLHWLVKGADFFVMHKYFEDAYNEVADQVDEVAERILMLGGIPIHQLRDYVEQSTIASVVEVPKGKESLKIAADNYEQLLTAYREIVKIAAENEDEGTVAMFSDFIGSTEKQLWMINSTLN